MFSKKSNIAYVAATLGLAAAIFIVDTVIPLGVSSGVLYVVVVFMAVRLPGVWIAVSVAAVCTGLVGAGAWLSPTGGVGWNVVANRGLAVFVIWTSLFFLLQRKRLRDQVEEHNALLQRQNAQLQEYMAELERSNRDLDDFAYITSHDLKSPLHGIDQLARWIIEDEGPTLAPNSRQRLEVMQQRVCRVQELLDDLRAYTRVGRGTGAQVEEVDSAVLVRQIADLVVPSSGFRLDIAADMPLLRTDKGPLEQVFLNLLDNAVKHHGHPIGKIAVSAQDKGEWIEFCVADDGPGIQTEYHQQVFDPFKKLESRDEVEGSGMGLAIVRKIVERYGGQVRLEDRPGGGARFLFTWPRG